MMMRQLIDYLNYHTRLYNEGKPEISDQEWDNKYIMLKDLEASTGLIYPDSPTQHIEYETKLGLNKFNLNLNKKLEELSSGMKVKYSVAIALSHKAELLILDEPTSGLDPVSRDEILDIFREIVRSGERAILFSTHITSDLDKCATGITYIHDGSIIYTGTKEDFVKSYLFVKDKTKNKKLENEYIACKELEDHIEGLIDASKKGVFEKAGIEPVEPDLEQIMVYLERSKNNEKSS